MTENRETGKRKICLIGQFPPPVHGLSKALDVLYRGLRDSFDLEKIDIKDNRKFPFNFWKIARSKADVFYLTLSQSRGGNVRDLLILSLIARKKKKCLVHLHGGYYRRLVEEVLSPRQRKKNFTAMGCVDGAIVLSPSLVPIFQDMVPSDKIFVVPNCIEENLLLSDAELAEKTEAMRKKDILDVLYLSNFNPEKGYREALALAEREKELSEGGAPRRFAFHFAGAFFEPKEREAFFGYIRKNGLEGYVTYHGVVTGEEKATLLKKCDFFLLLTRYPKEGQPISVLEGMGSGMAAVVTDHAAIGDMVTDGENGIVCRSGEEKDAAALYDRMTAMRSDLPHIAARNREKVRTEYSERLYLGRLRKIFASC